MFLLLPPSEGKTAPEDDGTRLDLREIVLPEVAESRQQVISSLAEVSDSPDAQKVLKIGARAMDEVSANTALHHAPAAPAARVYTGVLFDALEQGTLSAEQYHRASRHVLIFSGLFGVTRFSDAIPAYRCAMGVTLPGIGGLGTWWKKTLAQPLGDLVGDELLVDCRSGGYRTVFPGQAERTVQVNSVTEKQGVRTVVTHFAKAARGELSGMLLRQPELPQTLDEVAEVAATRWEVEVRPAQGRTPHQLDLISSAS